VGESCGCLSVSVAGCEFEVFVVDMVSHRTFINSQLSIINYQLAIVTTSRCVAILQAKHKSRGNSVVQYRS
jgi:hypothetical protein